MSTQITEPVVSEYVEDACRKYCAMKNEDPDELVTVIVHPDYSKYQTHIGGAVVQQAIHLEPTTRQEIRWRQHINAVVEAMLLRLCLDTADSKAHKRILMRINK